MKAYSLCLATEQLCPTSLFTSFDEVAQIDPFEIFCGSCSNTPEFNIIKLITLNGLSLIFMHSVIYQICSGTAYKAWKCKITFLILSSTLNSK